MKKSKKPKRISAWFIIILTILFVSLTGLLAGIQMKRYEDGILKVYALQQDGYVQLVLDQINIIQGRDNEEIIEDILGTLDASGNRYWTLSEKDSLVFVKDLLETNRYKGFTTRTYYESDSAEEFIRSLEINKVKHKTITVGKTSYVASGVSFRYNKNLYHMILLTNEATILDQNEYLNAKICLYLLAIIILLTLLSAGIALVLYAEKWYKEYRKTAEEKDLLIHEIEKLNDEMARDNLVNTKYTAFYANSLPMLLEKLEKRDVWPLQILIVKCEGEIEQRKFLQASAVTLDKRTLRVIYDENYLVLISVTSSLPDEAEVRTMVEKQGGQLAIRYIYNAKPQRGLENAFKELWSEVCKDGKETV